MKIFSYASWGVPRTGFDPSHTFVRSHFVSPLVLACIRTLLCIYCFTAITTCYTWLAHRTATISLKDVNIGSYTIQQSDAAIGQSFSFFTYLTFWSLGFYFLVSSIHTFMYAFRQRTWLHSSWPKPLQMAHSLYYSSITCFPFLVTIVFWGTMNSGWPTGRFEQWINISVHALNSLFAIVEIVLPATQPPPWTHLSVVLLVLSAYLGLAYITRETQGFYVYEWMNPAHGNWSIVLHIIGYAGGMVALFVLARCAIVARHWIAKKTEGARRENAEMEEKGIKLDDRSDTWSSEMVISKPSQARRSSNHFV
ncbi:uncharacterized protein K460DRAFT_365571 [Cucurbitaria berberidis CBS 394.84]|uniref:FAR-17a/AIG1-like protein n=1 Tax=Cucurbitaria berberidis CBS 394.84 TaxID=1168544 RepID=A0A9P4GFQ6_9PLEO|nr:uncharacterized protein K460DRAFT_365571 [Cucurbitaria berberidis CBS 394.84]KAF1844636.1 hypothetical protein K460DRAFT_365571 [Cucurbitaria berberidis CBS 394.84]